MRIHSPFRDYYDCMQTGEADFHWFRKKREESFTWNFPIVNDNNLYQIDNTIVGFCGKIYIILDILEVNNEHPCKKTSHAKCWNLEDVETFIDSISIRISKNRSKWITVSSLKKEFRQFYSEFDKNRDNHKKLFHENNCPIFIAQKNGHHAYRKKNSIITYNACLKDVEFYKLFDEYQAFQEIQMFLGTMKHPEKITVTINDEDLIKAKGFDKWSFRKLPTKRR